MKTIVLATALAVSLLVAAAPATTATELVTLEGGATVNAIDPAVDGWHGVTIIVWEDAAGEPQITILLDGQPIESYAGEDLPEIPGLDAGELPDAGEVPDAGELPDAGEVPTLPPAPGLPAIPILP